MSRSFKAVPHGGNIAAEARARFRRGLVPSPIGTADLTCGIELCSQRAKRVAKRQRVKKARRSWKDSY